MEHGAKLLLGDVLCKAEVAGRVPFQDFILLAPLDKMISSPEFGIKLLTALKDEQEKRKALESENEAM